MIYCIIHTLLPDMEHIYSFFFYSFSFVNFKFLSFAIVIFAYELIPAMGAPTAIFVALWWNLPQGRLCVADTTTGTALLGRIRHGDDAK
jgi:hypothetical protein